MGGFATHSKADHGYHPDKIHAALEKVYPEIMTKIQFEVLVKPSKAEKASQEKSGFVPGCAGSLND